MTANRIDLRQERKAAPDTPPELQTYLAQLVGEPFRFARVSYGDELTLHFGDLRPARSPKLKGHLYGSYLLGVRSSAWLLKTGGALLVSAAEADTDALPNDLGRSVRKGDIEANPLIRPDSRVLLASPFLIEPALGFGLQLRLSDGSTLYVQPSPPGADDADGDTLPELADWELASPSGLLSAGPGPVWAFKPSSTRPLIGV